MKFSNKNKDGFDIYAALNPEGRRVKSFVLPKIIKPIITPIDIRKGFINRYFLKRGTPDSIAPIIEVDQLQYNSVGNTIDPIYSKISIKWRIAGSKESYVLNGMEILGIKAANKNAIDIAEKEFTGIELYISGKYLEFV